MTQAAQFGSANGAATARAEEKTEKVRPTLFIALGGTGMEVCLRLRRRILNAVWGQQTPRRVANLAEFPLAQFINFDLDSGAITESGKSHKTDLLAEAVKFTEEEKIIERLDIDKYIKSDENLSKYPHIESWFPLTPQKVRDLGIDPRTGAGQLRALSRLYFFDKFTTIRDKIRQKMDVLQNSVTNQAALRKLGLETDEGKLRVVIVASSAGGTGSGCFLDMGYLVGWLAAQANISAAIDLYLLLPSGYKGANKTAVEANTYAALMEMESCMFGIAKYVDRWTMGTPPELPAKPYDDVYLLDTGNVAAKQTGNIIDLYDMAADMLFEDFASADFADRKRSVATNQQQHKIMPYSAPLPAAFGGAGIKFFSGYSTIGQAVLDTQGEARRSIRLNREVMAMLKAFFGITAPGSLGNRASDKEREDFLRAQLRLVPRMFTDLPKLLGRIELKHCKGEFTHYALADDLLQVAGGKSIPAQLDEKVDAYIQRISQEVDKEQWLTQLDEVRKLLERDTRLLVGGADRNHEVQIIENRRRLFSRLVEPDALPARLFERLDTHEGGGLDYTISLIEMLKDRLDNDATGLIHALQANEKRFFELAEALERGEISRELGNLKETQGGFSLFGNKQKQAEAILANIAAFQKEALHFYVNGVAAREAAALLKDISAWLGNKQGVDGKGVAMWSGFAEQIQSGRALVELLIADVALEVAQIDAATKELHATYLVLPSAEVSDDTGNPQSLERFRQWAEDAFKDFGGSRTLFAMLRTQDGKQELLAKLRNKALENLPARVHNAPNPLITQLRALPENRRIALFRDLLALAMPWVQYNLNGDFKLDSDKYKCFLGVADAEAFRREFSAEIATVIPTAAKITWNQISIVDSGVPGKLVCYVELSGIPLTPLTKLEMWRESYKNPPSTGAGVDEGQIPRNTHKKVTMFVHPVQFHAAQYMAIAEDFRCYLLAVGFGLLKRRDDGAYGISLKGQSFAIGDESALRQEGLDNKDRQKLVNQVADKQEKLTSPWQYAGLVLLYRYYMESVYKRRLVKDERRNREDLSQNFPHRVAEQLAEEMETHLQRLAAQQQLDGKLLLEQLAGKMEMWSAPLVKSRNDVYASEVTEDRLDKRQLVLEFFNAAWLEELFAKAAPVPAMAGMPPAAPGGFTPGAPPPPLQPQFQYFMTAAGQNYGPYPFALMAQYAKSGQVLASSMVWRDGLPSWLPAMQVPELAGMFLQASVAPPPYIGGATPPPPLN